MRKAVIDLGTNTFHLLIADNVEGKVHPLHKKQLAVKLGEGGINRDHIAPAAFERGIQALEQFRLDLNAFQVETYEAVGTSAIRGATNREAFLAAAKTRAEIEIRCISGLEEANYIAKGVLSDLPPLGGSILIMDIGGGSVEFILSNPSDEKSIIDRFSLDLGAARLLEKFQPSNPMLPSEYALLRNYLEEKLSGLMHRVNSEQIRFLVGSAGSFESILDLIRDLNKKEPKPLGENCFEISPEDFHQVNQVLIASTREERIGMRGLADFRVEMMVVASILIETVFAMMRGERMFCSLHSLKEGLMLSEE